MEKCKAMRFEICYLRTLLIAKFRVEHWCNDTDRGEVKKWEKNLFHFVHQKSLMNWPGIEPGLPSLDTACLV